MLEGLRVREEGILSHLAALERPALAQIQPEQLSLFERFNAFVNGVFDMTAIVYYLSVIGFFLFLSVQSLEKRRYN